MGFLDGLMGNASEISVEDLVDEFSSVLGANEKLTNAYKLIRDLLVLTNKRVIFVDKQGVTGKKVSYRSIPYKSITQFEVETAGRFDMDSELKIWVSGQAQPLTLELKSSLAPSVQRALASNLFA